MDTPYQDHINKPDFDHVYEPAEDSFLLLDAIEKDLDYLRKKHPTLCLEVGSGSGVVITAFGMAFPECFCISTDINIKACAMTLSTATRNKVVLDTVNMDLSTSFQVGKFDVVLFNPPYVVTESEECGTTDISASWAGGVKGREVIDRFLRLLPKTLAHDGLCYMLVIEDNIPNEIIQFMEGIGFISDAVIARKVRNEKQLVLRFKKRELYK